MRRYYAINLSLTGCDCLIVGGGTVALRKAQALIACGAQVRVVSPSFCPPLEQLEGVRLLQRAFTEGDVQGATLVFAATSDSEVNRLVARAARRHGTWVNVVDTPEECDFIVPATLRRGALSLSVSTDGACPALSRRVRQQLEELFPKRYAAYAGLLGELRGEILERIGDPAQRRSILRRLASEETWHLFDRQGAHAVRELADELIGKAT